MGNILNGFLSTIQRRDKGSFFGDIKSEVNSVINTILLLVKQFLWDKHLAVQIFMN